MLKKVIILLVLALLPAVTVLAASEQTTGLTFVGKIEEIASKTVMGTLGTERFLTIKLDSKPKLDFRITAMNAARFGLIDTDQPSAVITPGKVKGLGWKVRLTCDRKTSLGDPVYMVTNVERLD